MQDDDEGEAPKRKAPARKKAADKAAPAKKKVPKKKKVGFLFSLLKIRKIE